MRINGRGRHTLTFQCNTEVSWLAKLAKASHRRPTTGPPFEDKRIAVFSILMVSRVHVQGQGQHRAPAGEPHCRSALFWPCTNTISASS